MLKSIKHPDAGVALITALLIVALATITMVAMATRQKIMARYTAILVDRDQTWNLVLGGEAWAQAVLVRSAKENDWDSLDEPWAMKMAPMNVEGATVWGSIEDLQGRFNLNTIVLDGKQDSMAIAILERLLSRLSLDPLLATSVADWIDANDDPGGYGGAESNIYGRLKYPYRAANQPMQSATELMMVHGFTTKIWDTLKPFVVALPERTSINVNTASPELLSVLAGNISLSDAEQIVRSRFMNPFRNMSDFRNHPNLVQAKEALIKVTDAYLNIRSSYFLITAQAEVGRGRMVVRSLLRRNSDSVKVIRRSMGIQ